MIKTWRQRCEEHPDHDGIVSEGMIQARMQEEIDELRNALEHAERPQTHSEECWRWHHECAVAKIERMQIAIEGLARIGRNAVDQIIKLEKTK